MKERTIDILTAVFLIAFSLVMRSQLEGIPREGVLFPLCVLYLIMASSAGEIAKTLKVHEFRVKKTMGFCEKFTIEKLKSILIQLYEIDRNIKTGALEPELALELLVGRI